MLKSFPKKTVMRTRKNAGVIAKDIDLFFAAECRN